jgi:periplasmic protein TonB
MSTEEREKKDRRIAALGTVGINALLIVLLFFIVAWRAPNPPLPEYGIVLNFGLDTEGFGDIQPETPVGTPNSKQDDAPQSEPSSSESKEINKEESQPVEEPVEPNVVSEVESPVVVKEEKKTDIKPVEKVTERPKEKPVEVKNDKPKEEPKAVYKPNSNATKSSEGADGEGREGKPGNHGDNPGTTGDKGNPQGSLDSKALYGKPGGGGGGSSLDISGWMWDEIPKPEVPNNESGRIVFEIKVNADGEIVSIKTLERSVSPEAERSCRAEIQRLTFSKTGTNVPQLSTGRITFVIRSK